MNNIEPIYNEHFRDSEAIENLYPRYNFSGMVLMFNRVTGEFGWIQSP